MNLAPGSRVAGYLIEQQLGRGGMASVYRAWDDRLSRMVALKVLPAGLTRDHAFRTRFIRESRAAAAVDHPNVLPIYEAGEADDRLFIAMRFARGGDVRKLLRGGGALPGRQVWAIIAQVAAALDAAHEHDLVHRDVKPANVLLETPPFGVGGSGSGGSGSGGSGSSGRHGHVYLTDFGISKQLAAEQLTATGQVLGTPDYIAPEQIEGRTLDGRADQYSLACATYELLDGTPPFRRGQATAILYAQLSDPPPSIAARHPELPAAVDQVLSQALAKDPAGRYRTCSEFAARLRRALDVPPQSAPAQGRPAQGGPAQGGPAQYPPAPGELPPTGPQFRVEPPTRRREY